MKDREPNTPEETQGANLDRRQVFRGGVVGLAALLAGGASKSLASGQPLVLKHDNLRTSVADLFSVMRGDAKVRRMFITNPTDVILTSILPDYQGKLTDQRVSEANRFLFSLMANTEFRAWAAEYQHQINADIAAGRITAESLDRSQVVTDMAQAMARHGDNPLMVSMLNQPGSKAAGEDFKVADVEVTVETYIAIAAVLVIVIVLIDFNVNDPGDTGVQAKVSPSQMRSIADHLTRHAQQLKESGRLADPNAQI